MRSKKYKIGKKLTINGEITEAIEIMNFGNYGGQIIKFLSKTGKEYILFGFQVAELEGNK